MVGLRLQKKIYTPLLAPTNKVAMSLKSIASPKLTKIMNIY